MKNKLLIFGILLICLIGFVCSETNRVINDDFEGGNANNWDNYENLNNSGIGVTGAQAHSGTYSMKISRTAGTGAYQFIVPELLDVYQNRTLAQMYRTGTAFWKYPPNISLSNYSYSFNKMCFWHKSNSNSLVIDIYPAFKFYNELDELKHWEYGDIMNVSSFDTWTQYCFEFDDMPTGNQTGHDYMFYGIGFFLGNGGEVYIDDVEFYFYENECNFSTDCSVNEYCDKTLDYCLPKISNGGDCGIAKECIISSNCSITCLSDYQIGGVCQKQLDICDTTKTSFDSHLESYIMKKKSDGSIRHLYLIDKDYIKDNITLFGYDLKNTTLAYDIHAYKISDGWLNGSFTSNDWDYTLLTLWKGYNEGYLIIANEETLYFDQTTYIADNESYQKLTQFWDNNVCYNYSVEQAYNFSICNDFLNLNWWYCARYGNVVISMFETNYSDVIITKITNMTYNVTTLYPYLNESKFINIIYIDDLTGIVVYNKTVECSLNNITGNWTCDNFLNYTGLNISRDYYVIIEGIGFDEDNDEKSFYRYIMKTYFNYTSDEWWRDTYGGQTNIPIDDMNKTNTNMTGYYYEEKIYIDAPPTAEEAGTDYGFAIVIVIVLIIIFVLIYGVSSITNLFKR